MNKLDRYKEDIERLIAMGNNLHTKLYFENDASALADYRKEHKDLIERLEKEIPSFSSKYQQWYSEAYELVRQLLPSRLADFEEYYSGKGTRKEVTFTTYTIKDALRGLRRTIGWEQEVVADPSAAVSLVEQQVKIVESIKNRFESSLFDIKSLVHAELLDDELAEARTLLSNGYLRAAGALAGVALESHLKNVAEAHSIKIKKNPSLSDYNDTLKDAVYDTAEWRRIQHLGDLRNKCDHKKSEEPTKENIEDLLSGVDRVMKNIF